MPTSKSAAKRVRQNEKQRLANKAKASAMRSAIKRVDLAVAGGDKAAVAKAVSDAFQKIDKAAKGSVIHANTAARRKALVARHAAALKS